MRREFLPRTEPYRQSKLYANCQASLTIVVLTEIIVFGGCHNIAFNMIQLQEKNNQISAINNIKSEWPTFMKIGILVHIMKTSMSW